MSNLRSHTPLNFSNIVLGIFKNDLEEVVKKLQTLGNAPSVTSKNHIRSHHILKTAYIVVLFVKFSNTRTFSSIKIQVTICINKKLHLHIVINRNIQIYSSTIVSTQQRQKHNDLATI
jgi:hypothetical protein